MANRRFFFLVRCVDFDATEGMQNDRFHFLFEKSATSLGIYIKQVELAGQFFEYEYKQAGAVVIIMIEQVLIKVVYKCVHVFTFSPDVAFTDRENTCHMFMFFLVDEILLGKIFVGSSQ